MKTVKLVGGPLNGQIHTIGDNSTKLAVCDPEMAEHDLRLGEYRQDTGWRYVQLAGRA